MSGIFGFINLAGNASREGLAAMAERMARWGPDGVGCAFSDGAAFGDALLAVRHESRFEKMPHHDEKAGILFTAAARLDNRDELCETFGIAPRERPAAADGRLVLQAYRRWGGPMLQTSLRGLVIRGLGCQGTAAFPRQGPPGRSGAILLFPAAVDRLCLRSRGHSRPPGSALRNRRIAARQKSWFGHPGRRARGTYWKDVSLIPAAHTATLTSKGAKADSYWRLDEVPRVSLSSQEDCLEGFLEQFRRAVRVRLNSVRPVGFQLSAGLDSGAVTALAARELQEANQPLAAFTSVPLHPAEKMFPGNLTDEWPLAREVAKLYKNIEHIPVRADEIAQLAAIELSLEITRAPQHGAPNMGWIISIFEQARRRNLGVMLTGQLGDWRGFLERRTGLHLLPVCR